MLIDCLQEFFAGTQVGTDIIILKKSQNKQVQDISKFLKVILRMF